MLQHLSLLLLKCKVICYCFQVLGVKLGSRNSFLENPQKMLEWIVVMFPGLGFLFGLASFTMFSVQRSPYERENWLHF